MLVEHHKVAPRGEQGVFVGAWASVATVGSLPCPQSHHFSDVIEGILRRRAFEPPHEYRNNIHHFSDVIEGILRRRAFEPPHEYHNNIHTLFYLVTDRE